MTTSGSSWWSDSGSVHQTHESYWELAATVILAHIHGEEGEGPGEKATALQVPAPVDPAARLDRQANEEELIQ